MPSIPRERLCTVVNRRLCHIGADAADCRPQATTYLCQQVIPQLQGLKVKESNRGLSLCEFRRDFKCRDLQVWVWEMFGLTSKRNFVQVLLHLAPPHPLQQAGAPGPSWGQLGGAPQETNLDSILSCRYQLINFTTVLFLFLLTSSLVFLGIFFFCFSSNEGITGISTIFGLLSS